MLDGYVYAVGGWEGSARLDSVERYCQLNNSWSYVPAADAYTAEASAHSWDGEDRSTFRGGSYRYLNRLLVGQHGGSSDCFGFRGCRCLFLRMLRVPTLHLFRGGPVATPLSCIPLASRCCSAPYS